MADPKDTIQEGTENIPKFFSFKNDYIFTEVMKDTKVLKGFLMRLTGFDEASIKNITILPRHLDKDAPVQKLGILDCKLELNNNSIVNIELQIIFHAHWESRSLYYICKMLTDQYRQGPDGYADIKRCIHICILDFDLTDLADDFYSVFKLWDTEHDRVYSDLLEIHVIQLRKREAPNVKDNYPELYRWTQLFSIDSRKELESMTEQDEYIRAAARAMDDLNLDDAHREAAFYRYLQLMDEKTMLKEQERLKTETEVLKEKAENLKNEVETLETKVETFKSEAETFKSEAETFKSEAETLKSEAEAFKSEAETFKDQLGTVLSQAKLTLITILEHKFGPLSEKLKDNIRHQADYAKINDLITQASLAASLENFIECVPELAD